LEQIALKLSPFQSSLYRSIEEDEEEMRPMSAKDMKVRSRRPHLCSFPLPSSHLSPLLPHLYLHPTLPTESCVSSVLLPFHICPSPHPQAALEGGKLGGGAAPAAGKGGKAAAAAAAAGAGSKRKGFTDENAKWLKPSKRPQVQQEESEEDEDDDEEELSLGSEDLEGSDGEEGAKGQLFDDDDDEDDDEGLMDDEFDGEVRERYLSGTR
jgi:hypothetical protein